MEREFDYGKRPRSPELQHQGPKKPRGRPPKGKTWVQGVGWVPVQHNVNQMFSQVLAAQVNGVKVNWKDVWDMEEALQNQWLEAVTKEVNNLKKYQAYKVIKRSEVGTNESIYNSMCLLNLKTDLTKKARLVVCGNEMPMDQDVTASVTSYESLRVTLAVSHS